MTFTLAALAALVGAVVVAPPAHAVTTRMIIGAGTGSCPGGYVCLWELDNFQGTGYAFFNSEVDYAQLPAPFNGIQDFAWSFYSHGNTYDIRFYRNNYSGDSFILCRGSSIPKLPPATSTPPHVSPFTTEAGRGWRDQVSSHKFGSWC